MWVGDEVRVGLGGLKLTLRELDENGDGVVVAGVDGNGVDDNDPTAKGGNATRLS